MMMKKVKRYGVNGLQLQRGQELFDRDNWREKGSDRELGKGVVVIDNFRKMAFLFLI